tara:strand:- start:279 stop:512 length:234 start_codon:yes stop_codon:yes gene_type:complete
MEDLSMKSFIIEEKFTGYANIRIEAENIGQALSLYNRGHYKDSEYDMDDMFYDHEFCSINEEKEDIFIDINETGGKY